jgi:hypothetical protein
VAAENNHGTFLAAVTENKHLFSANFFWRPETAENRPKVAKNDYSCRSEIASGSHLFLCLSNQPLKETCRSKGLLETTTYSYILKHLQAK